MTSSAIYDLGYQQYSGERHGRAYSFWTLLLYSFRTAFGMGRGEKARRVPIVVTAMMFLPALVQVGISSTVGNTAFISYSNYLEFGSFLLALFAAAQGPELLVADKQNGSLALYLSRPISASDYALAKLAALTAAMMVLTVGPQLLLFGGRVFLALAPWTAFKAEYAKLLPIFGGSFLIALFYAALSLAISAFAVKRAFASAGVIAFFLLTPALSTLIRVVAVGDVKRYALLLNPTMLISGLSQWLFEVEASRRSIVGRAELPGQTYLWVMVVLILVCTLILLSRYRKNEA